MSDDRVRIRGTSEGLVITLGAGNLGALLKELDERLSSTASFFRGGRVALHVGPRELTTEELEALGHTISRYGVSLWAVIGDSAATQAAAEALGLETTFGPQAIPSPEAASLPSREPRPEQGEGPVLSGVAGPVLSRVEGPVLSRVEGELETEVEDAALRLAQDRDQGVLVRRTLRSGQVVQHPGHVIDEAVVCALSLAPLQLRIGNHIARTPEGREGLTERPEMASVQDGEIVAEPWEK